jgi:hypothetical protein
MIGNGMKHQTGSITALLFLLLILPALAQAAEPDNEEFKRNGFELFAGATFNHSETNASFGLSYERRVTEKFGIGGLVEYTNGREWVYAVPFSWRITDPWKVMVAPGWEHEEGENTYLTRVGTSYEFEIGEMTLAPEINFDFVDGDTAFVAGVSLGWAF